MLQLAFVVQAVRFGPLREVADPARRAHVPVLEDAVQRRHHAGQRSSQRIEPEHQHGDEQLNHHLHHHLERVEQHRAGDVDALRAVVDLMADAPQRRPGVRQAV